MLYRLRNFDTTPVLHAMHCVIFVTSRSRAACLCVTGNLNEPYNAENCADDSIYRVTQPEVLIAGALLQCWSFIKFLHRWVSDAM